MNKMRERDLRNRFERAGYPIFEEEASLVVEATPGPHEFLLWERESGLRAALHLTISAVAHIDLAGSEFSFWLPKYDSLYFETSNRAPRDLAYSDEDLVVKRANKRMREGESVGGMFFAHAISKLPHDLKRGDFVDAKLSIEDRFGNWSSGHFRLRISNEIQKRRMAGQRKSHFGELVINCPESELGEHLPAHTATGIHAAKSCRAPESLREGLEIHRNGPKGQ